MGLAQILRQEGRQNESITLISRQLRRKLGIHPELESMMSNFKTMSLEKLEELSDALLDFSNITDLTTWLHTHNEINS